MAKKKSQQTQKLSRDEYIKKFSLAEYIKVADNFVPCWFRHMKRRGYDFVVYGTGEWVENSYLVQYVWVFLGEFPIRTFPQKSLKLMNGKIVEAPSAEKKFYSQEDFDKYLSENKITLTEPVEL